ncbi:hypothetical protein ACEG82_RS23790, partial [Escherichia coli]
CPLTDLGGKTCIFSHPVYLFLREFSLQETRGGSVNQHSEHEPESASRVKRDLSEVEFESTMKRKRFM